jgi:hypothetical protein
VTRSKPNIGWIELLHAHSGVAVAQLGANARLSWAVSEDPLKALPLPALMGESAKIVDADPDCDDYASWLKGEPFLGNMVVSAKATVEHFGTAHHFPSG